jgi:deoxycytidine triphosphate deaminase
MANSPDYNPPLWKTQDPDWGKPDRKGMLLSDQIRKFCDRKLLISSGYDEKRLRPAAYTLTIGPNYRNAEGVPGTLAEPAPWFEMPPNSIVFVSIAESLDLPYYIAARFNLRVDWVYKGILLGTGPQVEPGFRGTLSCPLYNLTSRPHVITLGAEFATIDFERTTNFVNLPPQTIHGDLKQRGKVFVYTSNDPEKTEFLLFDQTPLLALGKYPPDYKIVSSLVQMQRELALWRKIGIAVVVSFIALTLAILNLQSNLMRETISNGKDIAQLKGQLSQTPKKEPESTRPNK